MRTMGLDVGTKTVGVAVSDPLGITAQAVSTVRRQSLAKDLQALRTIVEEYEVTRVVVGLPLNMDGTEGPRAQACRAFADTLSSTLTLPTELWDERLTTVAAQRALREGAASREKRREVVDQVAAALILQGWLDAHRAASPGLEDEP